jgi:hypothetical protein
MEVSVGKSINGVAETLPAPSMNACPAVYAALPTKTSDWDSHSVDDPIYTTQEPPAPPLPPADNQVFWTPEQMAVLSQQPVPYDHYYAHVSTQPGKTPEGALAATPPPPVPPQQYVPGTVVAASGYSVQTFYDPRSDAATELDGYEGVKSCDLRLQTSVEECIKFLQTYNTKPLQCAEVHGWHTATHSRQVVDGATCLVGALVYDRCAHSAGSREEAERSISHEDGDIHGDCHGLPLQGRHFAVHLPVRFHAKFRPADFRRTR